jgi:hypothetical protein
LNKGSGAFLALPKNQFFMLRIFIAFVLALVSQSAALIYLGAPATAQNQILQKHPVRPLPGGMDKVPVFNSNSPEVLINEGILLSTWSPANKAQASAHLNYAFEGKFDIFSHHISRPVLEANTVNRLMNVGVLAFNPGQKPIKLKILQALSYVNADAPFVNLAAYVNNADGRTFSGPGSRIANDMKRGLTDAKLTKEITIPPGQSRVIFSRSIPNRSAKSTLMRLHSDGKVQIASIALLDKLKSPALGVLAIGHQPKQLPSLEKPPGTVKPAKLLPVYRSPTTEDWQAAVKSSKLATPRDQVPTNPSAIKPGQGITYGRVAGVSQGSRWEAKITDQPNSNDLSLPANGQAVSFVISTLDGGRLGTSQIQSAAMLKRYPDTAYRGHGNYGTHYRLIMPLLNNSQEERSVVIKMQTPFKDDVLFGGLRFLSPVPTDAPIFFRGTVQIRYPNDAGRTETRQTHIVQRRGEQGQALVTVKLPAGTRRQVEIDLIYPPDASPPQVFTVESLGANRSASSSLDQNKTEQSKTEQKQPIIIKRVIPWTLVPSPLPSNQNLNQP